VAASGCAEWASLTDTQDAAASATSVNPLSASVAAAPACEVDALASRSSLAAAVTSLLRAIAGGEFGCETLAWKAGGL